MSKDKLTVGGDLVLKSLTSDMKEVETKNHGIVKHLNNPTYISRTKEVYFLQIFLDFLNTMTTYNQHRLRGEGKNEVFYKYKQHPSKILLFIFIF